MKRWVVCKKVLIDGAYAPAVDRHTGNYRCWSKDGASWMFCQIGIQDLTPVRDDPDCHVVPDVSFDLKLSALPAETRTAMRSKLQALGVTDYSQVLTTWTIRQFLRWLGRQLQPTMDPERGDVTDF